MTDSPFFTLHQIDEGVYAAVCCAGAGAMCNAGIVDLGGATLVFDTLLTHPAGAALRRAAEELTGRPVTYVVNSHWHGDHVLGNQAFPDATVFATERTRQLISEHVAIADRDRHRADLAEHTRTLSSQIARESDPRKRRGMEQDRADFQLALALSDSTEVVLPRVTVSDRVVLHGSRRSAELISYGGGHTESDLCLRLPADGIAFVGDLAPVRTHPWLGHGNPEMLLAILDRLIALDLHTIVPGHGLPGTPLEIALIQAYVAELKASVARMVAGGASESDLAALPIPPVAEHWEAAHVFDWNVRFIYGALTTKRTAEGDSE